jgi:hypothetical protein
MRWVIQLAPCAILGDPLAMVEKRLESKRMGTLPQVHASPHDLDSAGFRRVDL